jgi:hypothetical protein
MDYYLIFTDYSSVKITEEEKMLVADAMIKNKNYVVLNGNIHSTTKLGEILDEKTFFERYPDKREDYPNYTITSDELSLMAGEMSRKSINWKAGAKMCEGLQSYIDSQPRKGFASELLEQIKEKIALKKSLKEKKEIERGEMEGLGDYITNKYL